MKTKVVIVSCYGYMQPPNAEPLSAEILHSSLLSKFTPEEIDCYHEVLDYRIDPMGYLLADKLSVSDIKPDVLGISIPQSTYDLSISFLDAFFLKNPNTLIVLGHALPTHSPDIFLQKYSNALIVRGWGEETFCEIIAGVRSKKLNLSKIPNLMYFENEIKKNIVKWPTTYTKPIRYQPNGYFARIESSRGCHYDVCTFCTRQPKALKNISWFRYPVQEVLEEIRHIKSLGISSFTFTDEDFIGNDLSGAEELANGLTEISDIKFSLSVRVDNIINLSESEEMNNRRFSLLKLLKAGGLSLVYLGVESLSDTQLRRYGKGVTASESIKALNIVRDLEIPAEFGYILFDPFLTFDELEENISWLAKSNFWMDVGQLFNNLRVQKDTAFVKHLQNKNLLGKYDPNTMDYEYEFETPIIGKMASYCIQWKEEIDEVYSLARNVQRTKLSESPSDKFIYNYRLLEFNILKEFVKIADGNGSISFDNDLKNRRTELVIDLKQSLENMNLLESEVNLLKAINSYMMKWVNKN
ncbi:MAG: radical SAM protein [Anaerolineales bacterium]|nr:radical SAM protein [Anaerolineales bacterium]